MKVFHEEEFWHLLAHKNFPAYKFIPSVDPKLQYRQLCIIIFISLLAVEKKIPATQLSITWLDGQYWKLKPHEGSFSEKIAFLNSVCWFQVNASTELLPGNYKLVVRVLLAPNHNLQDTLHFDVSLPEGKGTGSTFDWTIEAQRKFPTNTLFDLEAGTFTVTGSQVEVVSLMIHNWTNGWWKRGLGIDYVEFIPIL